MEDHAVHSGGEDRKGAGRVPAWLIALWRRELTPTTGRIVCLFSVLLVFGVLLSPMLRDGIWKGHDRSAHTLRVLNTVSALADNQFPPIINSAHENAFGYSWNRFYPPLSAYLAAGCAHIAGLLGASSPFAGMKAAWLCIVLASGAAMYCFLRHALRSRFAAALGVCLYVSAPYFVSCVYIRFALGEIMMFVFLPLVALGLYSIFYEQGEKNRLLALGTSGLLLSNAPASIILLLCLAVFSLLHVKSFFNPRIVRQLGINIAVTLAVTAFFYVPFFEQWREGNIHAFVNMWGASLQSLREEGANLWWFLLPKKIVRMFFYYGFPLLFWAGWLFFKTPQKRATIIIALLSVGLTFAMSKHMPWPLIIPEPLAFVRYIQFPWRMLSVAVFLLCILAAYNAAAYITERTRPKALCATALACCLAMAFIFPSGRLAALSPAETHAYDYLPEKSVPFKDEFPKMNAAPVVIDGDAALSGVRKERSRLTFSVAAAPNPSRIELPFFAYLGYTAVLESRDGMKTPLDLTESHRGLWSVEVPGSASGTVRVAYTGTLAGRASFALSLAALAATALHAAWTLVARLRKKAPCANPRDTDASHR